MTHTIKRIFAFAFGFSAVVLGGASLVYFAWFTFNPGKTQWLDLVIAIEFGILSALAFYLVHQMETELQRLRRKPKAPVKQKRKASRVMYEAKRDAKYFFNKVYKPIARWYYKDAEKKHNLMRLFLVQTIVKCQVCEKEIEVTKMLGQLIDNANRQIKYHEEKLDCKRSWYYLDEQFRTVDVSTLCYWCEGQMFDE